ncbi:glycosyl hydrolase [Brevifollis gellanilyticus]|uniref:Glycosyl hydrolase n=2 Tax=Brevifollis gellanilyticus TaxID=748831 RepID=A0A512MF54_9BACT|nr:glycosyl hydrolase [Brevifollis gellanilyticus]
MNLLSPMAGSMKHLSRRAFASRRWLQAGLSLLLACLPSLLPAQLSVPNPPRELRGSWIATVHNINWPSREGLPVAQQQAELKRLIQNAKACGLNCLIFQVRSACEAMYESKIEPWSCYLSGLMSLQPSPKYDPLAFAIEEAHKQGLELHAWFNPYRALAGDRFAPSANHVRRQHPEWTIKYGRDWWLNPGLPEVRQRVLDVILDVTRRYDVDGIHIDDYFYPYPTDGRDGKPVAFNDAETYARYKTKGGTLELTAWRRWNVDETVRSIYEGIKATKRTVKFGISPFGLWRPNYPAGTGGGLDPYEHMGADSRGWLQKGWVDYLTPQLYWTIDRPKLGFGTYFEWWLGENTLNRHIWPGMNSSKIGDDRRAGEILAQISITRARQIQMPPGHFHWNFAALDKDLGKLGTLTKERAYNIQSILPASPWLSNVALPAPRVERVAEGKKLRWFFDDMRWENYSRWWVVQALIEGKWQIVKVAFLNEHETEWPAGAAAVSVRAAGRAWELGEPGVTSGK